MWGLLSSISAWIVQFFMESKFAKFTGILSLVTIYIGLFVAFIGAAYTGLFALQVSAPPELALGLSFLPPSLPAMISFFYSTLIFKRVLDHKKQIIEYVMDPVLARVEGQLNNRRKLPKRK